MDYFLGTAKQCDPESQSLEVFLASGGYQTVTADRFLFLFWSPLDYLPEEGQGILKDGLDKVKVASQLEYVLLKDKSFHFVGPVHQDPILFVR